MQNLLWWALMWQSRKKQSYLPLQNGDRLRRQLPEPQRSSLRTIPPIHHSAHHGLQPRLEEPVLVGHECTWTLHLAPRAPCHLTLTLPVLHLHKKSMAVPSWSWVWPAKFVPKLMDSPQPYLWRIQLAPRGSSSVQGGRTAGKKHQALVKTLSWEAREECGGPTVSPFWETLGRRSRKQ